MKRMQGLGGLREAVFHLRVVFFVDFEGWIKQRLPVS
jgi:hypothetical protein